MKTSTIVDVAKKAGVSVSTVSRYINETGPVGVKARESIKRVMHELNYIPSNAARSMKTKQTKTIAIIIPDFANSFYSEMLAGVVPVAEELGYLVITCSTNDDAKYEIYKLMIELVAAGKSIIMISSEMNELIGMSDRIAVMHNGHLRKVLQKQEVSQDTILRIASGL
jgi:DNA-binding LacI/PurR family transcriptional regulator